MKFIKNKAKRVAACVSSLVIVAGVITGCKNKDAVENAVNKMTFSEYLAERCAVTQYEAVSDVKAKQTLVTDLTPVVSESEAHVVMQVADKNLLVKEYNVKATVQETNSQDSSDDPELASAPKEPVTLDFKNGDTFMVYDGTLYVKTQTLYDTINTTALHFADDISAGVNDLIPTTNSLSDLIMEDYTDTEIDAEFDVETGAEIDETLSAGQLARNGSEVEPTAESTSEPVVTSDESTENSYVFDGFTFENGDSWVAVADINEIYTAEQQDSIAKAIKDFSFDFYTSTEDTVETIENGYKLTINSKESLLPYIDFLIERLEKAKTSDYDFYMKPVVDALQKSAEESEMKATAKTFIEDLFKSAAFEYTSEDIDKIINLAFQSLSDELEVDESQDEELKEAWDSAFDEMLNSLKSYKSSISEGAVTEVSGESETTGVTAENSSASVESKVEADTDADIDTDTGVIVESELEPIKDFMFVYTTVKVDGVYTDTFEFSLEQGDNSLSMSGTSVIDTNAEVKLTKPETVISNGTLCGSLFKGVLDEFLSIDEIRSFAKAYLGDVFGDNGNLSITKIRMYVEDIYTSDVLADLPEGYTSEDLENPYSEDLDISYSEDLDINSDIEPAI